MRILVTLDPMRSEDLGRFADVSGAEVVHRPAMTPDELSDALDPMIDVAFMNGFPSSLDNAAGLRWVQSAHAGVDEWSGSPVLQSDSPVTATLANGLAAPYIAQYVMATILYRVNRLGPAMTMKAMKSWPHSITPLAAEPVFGRTLGLIGFGNIGRLTGRLAHGLGMQVIALAPTGTPRSSFSLPHIRSLAQEDYRVELVAREDIGSLLRRSDFLSLALPATPATTRMVDARMLAQVKPGAWIVNVGRGAVIDEDALLDALDNGNLGGATLDVTAIEPLPAEHSFFAHPRVFLTPHVSGYFQDYNVYASMLFAENLERYVDDQPLFNLFDPAKGY